jgi:hypothetical protein
MNKNNDNIRSLNSPSGVGAILLACLLALFSSCSDEWLETRPRDMITSDDFWQTEAHLQMAIAGCYMAIADDYHYNWESWQPYEGVVGKIIQWGEIRADNIIPASSAMDEEKKIATCNIIASNKVCDWAQLYGVINNCNTLLDNAHFVLENDETTTEGEVNTYIAEALAIRSLMYFYLVRNFKEVPLVLQSSKTNTQEYEVAKSPENEILVQITGDLEKAYAMARVSYDNLKEPYDKGRFTRTSIMALLADVYLWAERYDDCIQACNTVLSDRKAGLVIPRNGSEWLAIFQRANSGESLFEIQYGNTMSGKVNNMLFQCYGSNAKSAHFTVPNSTSWNLDQLFLMANSTTTIDPYDIRWQYSYRSSVNKFPYSETASANWIIYRLAEVYFMKAEALLQSDYEANRQDALHIVNQIYMRAHPALLPADTVYTLLQYDTKQKLNDLILKEKQKEFLFEGKRWYDLLRTSRREKDNPMRVFNEFIGRNIDVSYAELAMEKYKNEWARYLPVPLHDLEINKLLVQNPFYETIVDR